MCSLKKDPYINNIYTPLYAIKVALNHIPFEVINCLLSCIYSDEIWELQKQTTYIINSLCIAHKMFYIKLLELGILFYKWVDNTLV